MNINIKVLKHLFSAHNKLTVLRYFFYRPSLIFGLKKKNSPLYFSRTLENLFSEDIVSCLHYSLPENFLKHLEKVGRDGQGFRLLLYYLVRKHKPGIVFETGVDKGKSSMYILAALEENKKGHLYSIDRPAYEIPGKKINKNNRGAMELEDGQKVSAKNEVGELVPDYLKNRWTLILGDAREKLPQLLKEKKEIDIFFHDSLHTYDHMMYEYETAWPFISRGGLLLSHDVHWTRAFLKFSKKVKSKTIIYKSFGIIKKE